MHEHEPTVTRVQVYEDIEYTLEEYEENEARIREVRDAGGGYPVDEDGIWIGGPEYDFLIEKYGGREAARSRMHIHIWLSTGISMHDRKLDDLGLLVVGEVDEPPYIRSLVREEVYRAFLEAPRYIATDIKSGMLLFGDADATIERAVRYAAEADAAERQDEDEAQS